MTAPFDLSALPGGVAAVASGDCARWVHAARRSRRSAAATHLDEIMPPTFAAYARVLHPPWRIDGQPIGWADAARAAHHDLHRLTQWPAIAEAAQGRPWDEPPPTGTIPAETCAPLAASLAAHASSRAGVFAYWHGYAFVPGDAELCLTGPVAAACEIRFLGVARSPTYWWPDSREWLVVSDPDLHSSYVGGSAACIAALLQAPAAMEVFPAFADDRVDYAAGG